MNAYSPGYSHNGGNASQLQHQFPFSIEDLKKHDECIKLIFFTSRVQFQFVANYFSKNTLRCVCCQDRQGSQAGYCMPVPFFLVIQNFSKFFVGSFRLISENVKNFHLSWMNFRGTISLHNEIPIALSSETSLLELDICNLPTTISTYFCLHTFAWVHFWGWISLNKVKNGNFQSVKSSLIIESTHQYHREPFSNRIMKKSFQEDNWSEMHA